MPKLSEQAQESRRAHILSAAEACFARAGFHRTTMQDICREAGVSPGALYLYFASKEALIEGIAESSVAAMVALMDEGQLGQALEIAQHLRAGGINTEVQMEPRKIGKQFQYASRAGIRFVVLAGEDELARGVVAVKDLVREQQFEVPRAELAGTLRVELEQARALAGR